MNKQDAIKKAYGERWESVKDSVDNDGWVDVMALEYDDAVEFFDAKKYVEPENNFSSLLMRPKSLKGIENNNGWIKLNGTPNEINFDGDVFIINKHGDISINANGEYLELGYATHYQPIIKPQPPIY